MTGTRSIRKEQAALTAAALKQAARTVFARNGYLNTKITEITTEAGRASGSFYNHFASKEDLLVALLADIQRGVDGRVDRHGEDHDLSDPAVLRAHVEVFYTTFRTFRPEMIALNQAAMVDPEFALQLQTMMAPERDVMIAHVQLLQEQGVDLPGPPALVAGAMIALMWQFAYEHVALESGLPDAEAIDLLTAFILRGIAGTVPASTTPTPT